MQSELSKKLGTENISKLMVNLSLPAFIGMMVMALYNVVDTIFIARGVGTLGVAGLTIAFPIQMIMGAFALAMGVGGAAVVSIRLGEKQDDKANEVFGHIVWLVIFFSLLLVIIALLFLEPLLRIFGATEVLLPYASDYLSILLLGSIFLSFAMATNNVVRAEGNAKMAMSTMLVSSVINIILDPIFIFGLDMGISGAATATIISQACAAIWIFTYFMSGKSSVSFTWIGFMPKLSIVKEIVAIGSSTFVRQIAASVSIVAINWMVLLYGSETQIAIYGIINRILMFGLMPMFGIVQGMQPIVGYNYGAKQYSRVGHAAKLSFMVATTMSIVIWIIALTFAEPLISIFTTDQQVINQGAETLRLMFLLAPVIGFQMVSGGLYQALGKAKISFVLSIARQLLFLIPIVLVLPHFIGVIGVWLAFPISDFFAFLLSLFIITKDRKMLFRTDDLKDTSPSLRTS
ncbi:MATE family efflux transporter [Bacillus carboniphilus]|uniref:Multidrug export protein MepA n=1 Tax=Bacillus carboniphilus TaxID=86663 RepID=A0ABY9JST2_9BACI|nr:MATE family efflux transporter [Bacillus carboniphilus]WLR42456.1 MATE family efflux transporter [Bacillus carboniphilus]